MPASAGHEIRALPRARPAAASGFHHLARHRPAHHRLLRLAMGPVTTSRAARPSRPPDRHARRQDGASGPGTKAPRPGDRARGNPLPEGGGLALGKAHAV
ncbi:DUF6274 family protein [Streptomyces sp. NBC_01240]|uniref:DUF6274 family protein n=1 Tax=Streptomyces sp. NBC_01240 TaxID=2903793 RepID=UPI002E0E18F7|nr:DUF6274 family protein [Streptomyces sp. NBC_01240]